MEYAHQWLKCKVQELPQAQHAKVSANTSAKVKVYGATGPAAVHLRAGGSNNMQLQPQPPPARPGPVQHDVAIYSSCARHNEPTNST